MKKLLNIMRALSCTLLLSLFATLPTFAVSTKPITLSWGSGQTVMVNIPVDIYDVVAANQSQIEQALTDNNVTQAQVSAAVNQVEKQYDKLLSDSGFKTANPYSDAVNGLNEFCDDINNTLPNTQTLQNVWAEAWIGQFIPNFKFGFGVNAGVATLDITSLKTVADALNIDTGDLSDQDKLVFPTVAADLRLGGIILPFDFGFTFCTFDTRDFDSINDNIDPAAFDYFTIGGDLRWRLFNFGGKYFHFRGSVSGGGYYTKGGLEVSDDGSSASLDFKSTTLFAGAQISAKALCFVPFFGGRLMLSKSSVDWKAHANWESILDANGDANIKNALSWGILPQDFTGGATSSWGVRPQVYGGLGIDLFIIDVTVSGSYDFVKDVLGGAVSVRFSI